MVPLALGISLDVYLIAGIIAGRGAALIATTLFAIFMILWFELPRAKFLQRLLGAR